MTKIAILAEIVIDIIKGIALKCLWKWFMVSTFGLPEITVPQAIGMCLIMSFLTRQYIPKKDDLDTLIDIVLDDVSAVVTIFVTGWIVHFFL